MRSKQRSKLGSPRGSPRSLKGTLLGLYRRRSSRLKGISQSAIVASPASPPHPLVQDHAVQSASNIDPPAADKSLDLSFVEISPTDLDLDPFVQPLGNALEGYKLHIARLEAALNKEREATAMEREATAMERAAKSMVLASLRAEKKARAKDNIQARRVAGSLRRERERRKTREAHDVLRRKWEDEWLRMQKLFDEIVTTPISAVPQLPRIPDSPVPLIWLSSTINPAFKFINEVTVASMAGRQDVVDEAIAQLREVARKAQRREAERGAQRAQREEWWTEYTRILGLCRPFNTGHLSVFPSVPSVPDTPLPPDPSFTEQHSPDNFWAFCKTLTVLSMARRTDAVKDVLGKLEEAHRQAVAKDEDRHCESYEEHVGQEQREGQEGTGILW